jgi:phosphomannomutase
MPVMPIDLETKAYICPGERHAISRSVHLARLAAAFPACRDCPLAEERPQSATRDTPLVHIEKPPVPKRELLVGDGLRGVFLNAVTRGLADAVASQFAQALWERAPVGGHNDGIDRGARRARPTVVVGYDERPSSPTIFAASVAALRRMGCHILDVGLVTKPCFWFAVDHWHAAGGLFVTGSGCEPAWTGMDFLWAGARPASMSDFSNGAEFSNGGGILDPQRRPVASRAARPTRAAGTHRTFRAMEPYEKSLAPRFAGLNLRKIACASSSPLVGQLVQRIFKDLSCDVAAIDLPVKIRNPAKRRDEGILRLSSAVREGEAQAGILIDDDAQRCGFVDERGRHVSSTAIARLVAPQLLAEQPGSALVLEASALIEIRPLIEAMGGRCHACASEINSIATAVREHRAVYGGGESGRHWFYEGYANCDALPIVARVLQALSRAEQPFSQLAVS